jgi:hypothetical protein
MLEGQDDGEKWQGQMQILRDDNEKDRQRQRQGSFASLKDDGEKFASL